MIKKVLATGAVAASILGLGSTQAMAIANDGGTTTLNGNGASQAYGNSETHGDWSPQFALIQGSLNKPCIALPAKANLGSLIGLVPISVQDINVLSSPQNQQCTEARRTAPVPGVPRYVGQCRSHERSGNGSGGHERRDRTGLRPGRDTQ
ncbi:rodlin [Streptomyces griseus]|uniref:rodlin n=5 Tax=Streptomyces TaxID=1883 RepID=UPI000ABD7F48|nr:rodlin [Streptomyces griseus]